MERQRICVVVMTLLVTSSGCVSDSDDEKTSGSDNTDRFSTSDAFVSEDAKTPGSDGVDPPGEPLTVPAERQFTNLPDEAFQILKTNDAGGLVRLCPGVTVVKRWLAGRDEHLSDNRIWTSINRRGTG